MSEPSAADWIGAIGSMLGGLGALAAVGVAHRQLRGLVRSLRQGTLGTLLQIEIDMNARKQKVDDAAFQLQKEMRKLGITAADVEDEASYLEGCIENWLNSVDRLAFCIDRGLLREKEWKSEYQPYFKQLIEDYPARFGSHTLYVNIVKMARRWHIHIPAVEANY